MALQPDRVWGSLGAAGLTYEAYGLFGGVEGDTLSERLREWFHTDHPLGKVAFVGAYAGFSAWFLPHIVCRRSGDPHRLPAFLTRLL